MVRLVWMAAVAAIAAVAAFLMPGGPHTARAAGNSSDLELAITEPVDGAPVINGDTRRFTIVVTNGGDADAGPVGIEIEIIGGTIDMPPDDGIRWRERGNRLEGRLARMAPGESVAVSLDVSFIPVLTGASTHMVGGGLVVTARVRSDAESIGPVITDEWVMANCGAVFHADLQRIAENDMAALDDAVGSAKQGWRSLAGRWVFDPGRVRGDDGYRSVVTEANRLVRARGVDTRLRDALKERTLSRLLRELRAYVGQRQTPAICTGAPQYMSFLESAMVDLRDTTAASMHLFEDAGQHADWKLLEAEAALSGVPAAGGSEATARAALTILVHEARDLWLSILEDDASTGRLPGAVERLQAFSSRLSALPTARDPVLADAAALLESALGAIEAFAYMQNAHAHHQTVTGRFDATMNAVRDAHARECTC